MCYNKKLKERKKERMQAHYILAHIYIFPMILISLNLEFGKGHP